MDAKEILAKNALEYMKNVNIIGVGTGRTVKKLIEQMHIQRSSFNSKFYIASSVDTELTLSSYGFRVLSIFSGITPDIYVDSFDYLVKINGNSLVMIKGGGGALLREKVLSYNSSFRLFLGEFKKIIQDAALTSIKVPIEIVPASLNYVINAIKNRLNLQAEIRMSNGKMGPEISDNGNILLDILIRPEKLKNLCNLDLEISEIPGVIETGIFCNNLYDTILLADENGRLEVIKKG